MVNKPIVEIMATHQAGGVLAEAVTENGEVIDSHLHGSEGWLLSDWGLHDYTIFNNEGMTDVRPGANTYHHQKIRKIMGQPFVLKYGDKQVVVS